VELLKAFGKTVAFVVVVFLLWLFVMTSIAYSIKAVQFILSTIS